jgi:hypothetical protein
MSDINMTAGSLVAVKDPPTYTGNDFTPGNDITVVGKKRTINLGVEITGDGFSDLASISYLDNLGNHKVKDSGVRAGAQWTVSYYAESFGPGSNDVVLGTKYDYLDYNVTPTKISQEETTAKIDLTNVKDVGSGVAGQIKPGIYKITAVVEWKKSDVDAEAAVPGHSAFIEGGTFEVFDE